MNHDAVADASADRVHGAHQLNAVDSVFRQLLLVHPAVVVNEVTQQCVCTLRLVFVSPRRIDVLDHVHQEV